MSGSKKREAHMHDSASVGLRVVRGGIVHNTIFS
jgi:hypothetical protein